MGNAEKTRSSARGDFFGSAELFCCLEAQHHALPAQRPQAMQKAKDAVFRASDLRICVCGRST
ncbi:hypothetical protein ACC690_38720, partial [Rhizobium johnstonii]|uniref:hypothetical protein n=1 Tax=Rhizobium johnstonii TaxID=3019933 RepID=UPI003F978D29